MTDLTLEQFRAIVAERDAILMLLMVGVVLCWFLFEQYVARMEKAIKGCSLCRAKVHG